MKFRYSVIDLRYESVFLLEVLGSIFLCQFECANLTSFKKKLSKLDM